jgi:hypothetical protein
MYLIYFDENKYSEDNPYFFLGGVLVEDQSIRQYEDTLTQIQYNFFGTSILSKDTEMHGMDIFQGKGAYKRKKLTERLTLFNEITSFIIRNAIPIRMVCIDVNAHRSKYIYPQPEYSLGLMLILERFCDFLDSVDGIGIVFGDYEKDELTRSILDFSQFKVNGKTPMYFGRPLGRLVDTIYFTHSHHSRFLQVADILVYFANRYENAVNMPAKWHDKEVKKMWDTIKGNTSYGLQRWPEKRGD